MCIRDRDPAVVLDFSPRIGQRTPGLKVNGSVLRPAWAPVCISQVQFRETTQLRAVGWCLVGGKTCRVRMGRCILNKVFLTPIRPMVMYTGKLILVPFVVTTPRADCWANGAMREGPSKRNCRWERRGWLGRESDGNGFSVWIDPNKTGVQSGQTASDSLGQRCRTSLSLFHDTSPFP